MPATLPEKIDAFSHLTFEEQKKIVLELLDIFKKYGDPFDVIEEYIRTSQNVEKSDLLEVYSTIARATEEEKILEDNASMERLQQVKEKLLVKKAEEEEERKRAQQEANILISNF